MAHVPWNSHLDLWTWPAQPAVKPPGSVPLLDSFVMIALSRKHQGKASFTMIVRQEVNTEKIRPASGDGRVDLAGVVRVEVVAAVR